MALFLNEINKLAFIIAPVFWNLVYRSIMAVVAGFSWIFVSRILKNVMGPFTKVLGFLLVFEILVFPVYEKQEKYSIMQVFEPVQHISYREEYDMYENRYFIAQQDDKADHNGVPDVILKEKADRRYIKSLICDITLPLIWLCGTAAGFIWLIISGIKLDKNIIKSGREAENWLYDIYEENKQLLKIKRKKNVPVIITDMVSVPAVSGLFRSKILLPSYVETMDRDTVANILVHEQHHIKRGDVLFNYFILAIQTVYWFNPLVVKLLGYQRQETEILTDYYVLNKTNSDKEYMSAMVQVLAHNTTGVVSNRMMCMTDSARNMKQRIEFIKSREYYNKNMNTLIWLAVLIYALFSKFMAPVYAESPPPVSYVDEYGAMAVEKNSSIGVQGMNIECNLPWNWTVENNQRNSRPETDIPVPPGEFDYVVDIYQNEEFIGYLGFAEFEPYTGEIPQAEYHKTVWTGMRLSSMTSWEPFTPVKQTETGEVGIVQINYTDYKYRAEKPDVPSASLPQYTSQGILAYNKDDHVYAGFAFLPDTVSADALTQIASSLSLTSQQEAVVENMTTVYKTFTFDRNGKKFYCGLPEKWSISFSDKNANSSGIPLPMGYYGEFENIFHIFDGDELIGRVGVNSFTPYLGEIPAEEYYKTVFSGLRTSSFFTWDNFRSVHSVKPENYDSGRADIKYLDYTKIDDYPGAKSDIPQFAAKAAWAYDMEKEFYVCIGFIPGTVNDVVIGNIASNIKFDK